MPLTEALVRVHSYEHYTSSLDMTFGAGTTALPPSAEHTGKVRQLATQ